MPPVPESNSLLPSDNDENYDCEPTIMGLLSLSSESSFAALRRTKPFLRAAMTEASGQTLLHVHQNM